MTSAADQVARRAWPQRRHRLAAYRPAHQVTQLTSHAVPTRVEVHVCTRRTTSFSTGSAQISATHARRAQRIQTPVIAATAVAN